MAIDYASNLGWHEGEVAVRSLLHVPERENPTSHGITPSGTQTLRISPLIALGTIDNEDRPWTTLIGGKPGFVKFLGQSTLGLGSVIDQGCDPVFSALLGSRKDGLTARSEPSSRVAAGLAIDLWSRKRVKLFGRMVVGPPESSGSTAEEQHDVGQDQLFMKVEQSIGNCPKYLNKKEITQSVPTPQMISQSLPLVESAISLLRKVDMFFISSAHRKLSMDTNYRGGPPGFVRVLTNDASGTVLVYPEYSGNRIYQTLGNLTVNPLAGLVFPDLDNGDVLHVTCTTDIIVGKAAAALLPRSNLAVKATVRKAYFVRQGLNFRGQPGEPSPYNPPVRYLTNERKQADIQAGSDKVAYVKMLRKDLLTPSIAKIRFSISDPVAAGRWSPGQYVALAFEDELSAGYSHMRDDDPKSLNDDYVRTFTVSSAPGQDLPYDEFEITMRNVGVVTNFLFRQNVRAGLELPLKGFGGTFKISQSADEILPFVAGGIGITPLLPYLPQLDTARVRLFWTINIQDVGLVNDTLKNNPSLGPSTFLFLSGIINANNGEKTSTITELERSQVTVVTRRMVASDVQGIQNLSSKWYICTGKALRQSLLLWLSDKEVIFEDFDY